MADAPRRIGERRRDGVAAIEPIAAVARRLGRRRGAVGDDGLDRQGARGWRDALGRGARRARRLGRLRPGLAGGSTAKGLALCPVCWVMPRRSRLSPGLSRSKRGRSPASGRAAAKGLALFPIRRAVVPLVAGLAALGLAGALGARLLAAPRPPRAPRGRLGRMPVLARRAAPAALVEALMCCHEDRDGARPPRRKRYFHRAVWRRAAMRQCGVTEAAQRKNRRRSTFLRGAVQRSALVPGNS